MFDSARWTCMSKRQPKFLDCVNFGSKQRVCDRYLYHIVRQCSPWFLREKNLQLEHQITGLLNEGGNIFEWNNLVTDSLSIITTTDSASPHKIYPKSENVTYIVQNRFALILLVDLRRFYAKCLGQSLKKVSFCIWISVSSSNFSCV